MQSWSHPRGILTTRAILFAAFCWLWLAICEAVNQDIDLALMTSSTGFTMSGADVDDSTGYSVRNAGDVNMDGIADLIIGAFLGNANGRTESGVVYIIFGREKGVTPSTNINLANIAANGSPLGFATFGSGNDNNGALCPGQEM